jgi:hypothetical protein
MYFDWINSQYEGTTEAQTLTNLDFFEWMVDTYGMPLDIYSLDVGNIDDGPYTAGVRRLIPYHYGNLESREFKEQFPNGFAPAAARAAEIGTRLGIWLGPGGFGTTPEDRELRKELMVSLCRDLTRRRRGSVHHAQNNGWDPITYDVNLDETIGLGSVVRVFARLFFPW